MLLKVEEKSVRDLVKNFQRYDNQTKQKVGEAINTSLKNVAKGARGRLPPKHTGNLRKGIKKSFRKAALGGSVRATAPHAHLIEFGTEPHSLAPKSKKVMTIKANGETVAFAQNKIHHPGSNKKPFLQPAYFAEKHNYMNNLKKAVQFND